MGGAIAWSSINVGEAIINDSIFEDTWAVSYTDFETKGGAIYVETSSSSGFRLSVSRSTFRNCSAGFEGGSVFVELFENKCLLEFADCVFENSYSAGGSILFMQQSFNLNSWVDFHNVIASVDLLVIAETITTQMYAAS